MPQKSEEAVRNSAIEKQCQSALKSTCKRLAPLVEVRVCSEHQKVHLGGFVPNFALKQKTIEAIRSVAKEHGLEINATLFLVAIA